MRTAPPVLTYAVVSTRYVVPPKNWRDAPYTEIVVAADVHDPQARRLTLITRDPALIARALLLEGTEQYVGLTYRSEAGPKTRRLVLEDIR